LNGVLDGKVTERESERRKDIVHSYQIQRREIMSTLKKGKKNTVSLPHDLTYQEARTLTVQGERAQNELLDELGDSLVRQQSIGIGNAFFFFFFFILSSFQKSAEKCESRRRR
jgi:hypothetical protein